MEIGLIYSRKDPRQAQAREFVKKYIRERGILARIVESDQPVHSPTVVINGHALRDQRKAPRSKDAGMYPSFEDIARAIEKEIW